jgi:predicted nuclease with TOPRIM domain
MMKNENLERLSELRIKVEKLINLHERLNKENKQLLENQNQLKNSVKDLQRQANELEEKNKVIKLAQMVSGSDQNSREIKLKINEYIREIDKCIALINR